MKRKTTKEFIDDARAVHGDKYDYSKVDYVNENTKICIVDSKYGEFWMTPKNHLKGQGHPDGRREKNKRLVFGVGINDSTETVRGDKCYVVWRSMLERCCSQRWKKRFPTYSNCAVCEEWKTFSCFREWFNQNYIEGYDLDKDLFSQGSGLYSPSTCVFLPQEINKAILRHGKDNGLKLGVHKSGERFKAIINVGYKINLGVFDTEDDAHEAYVIAKRRHIKTLAKVYLSRGEINQRVYDALLICPIPEY